jgi:hypothetical protein
MEHFQKQNQLLEKWQQGKATTEEEAWLFKMGRLKREET